MFSESGRHQFLPGCHSQAMPEPVFRDVVVVFVNRHTTCISVVILLSHVSMLDMSCSVSIYIVVLSLALTLVSSMRCQSGVVVCSP